MGKVVEDKNGFVKLIVSIENRKILDCRMLGTDAFTLIHEVLVATKAGAGTIYSIRKTIHIHPALSGVLLTQISCSYYYN
jgi:mycothione reductase